MFTRIRIRGFGPHDDSTIDLDANGPVELSGPSQSGKSTVGDAICFALWDVLQGGGRVHESAIRTGCDVATIDLWTRSGSRITRSISRPTKAGSKPGQAFAMTRTDGTAEDYSTRSEWLAALKRIGSDADRLRYVIAPKAWRKLADSSFGGKELRDFVSGLTNASIGVSRDSVATIMAERSKTLDKNDPMNLKAAEKLRTKAGQVRDDKAGVAKGNAATVLRIEEHAPAGAPSEIEMAESADVIEREEAWKKVERALEAKAHHKQATDRFKVAHEDWALRMRNLGDEPAGPDMEPLRRDLAECQRKAERARQAANEASKSIPPQDPPPMAHPATEFSDRVNQAKRIEADLIANSDPKTCPTCLRDGWEASHEDHAEQLAAATKASTDADTDYEAEVERLKVEHAAMVKAHEGKRAEAMAILDAATEKVTQHERETRAAADAVRAAEQEGKAANDWHRKRSAMPAEPTAPKPMSKSIESATAPTFDRPTYDEVEQAGATQHAADAHGSRVEEHARQLSDARADLVKAQEIAAEKQADWERLDALVWALREEPGRAFATAVLALGDIGPVGLALDAKGTGCDVTVDGLPWELASDGRQVVADVWLRDAFRRALGVPLPLIIDGAQDVGGQELPTPGACIVLRTTDGAPSWAIRERDACRTPTPLQLVTHMGYEARFTHAGTELWRGDVREYVGPSHELADWLRAQGHRVPGGV